MSIKKIHPKLVNGKFANLRIFFILITQIVFFIFPWINYSGRQAILFNISIRRFYIFNMVLFPGDLIFLSGLLLLCAFSLFWWTTIAGRVWCGYACPQTVYTEIMLFIDYLFEGDRNKRIKLENSNWTLHKIKIKFFKYIFIFIFCFFVGITFVGWFTPIKYVVKDLLHFNLSFIEVFSASFYGGITFLFAHILREQICKYMCPYARFQSVMYDKDTLVISYDFERGEPRGIRKKGIDNFKLGDCINCTLCVQVCPVGIDIRDGLQYECIGCAACIDACDDVMVKVDKPKGLIRYTTEAVLNHEYKDSDIIKKFKRPSVLAYFLVSIIVFFGLIYGLLNRNLITIDIIKDRGILSRQNKFGWTENVYTLNISNSSSKVQIVNSNVKGFDKILLTGFPKDLTINSGDVISIPVEVSTPYIDDNESIEKTRSNSYKIKFIFTYKTQDDKSDKQKVIEKNAVFLEEK